MLQTSTRTVIDANGLDIQELVRETYGYDLNMAEDQCSQNDSTHEFSVTGNLTEAEREELAEGIEAGDDDQDSKYLTGLFLNDLASRGLAPRGEYVVGLSW